MDRKLILKDLKTLIAIPSFTPDKEQTRIALDWVLSRAREMGFRTGMTPEGDAGFAEIGEGDVTLGVLAHVDIVGIGDAAKWKFDPLALTESEGMLYGRGVEDDKGPVVQSLYALKEVLDSGVRMKKRIRLIVGTSEESVWTDMEHYKAAFGTPDYGFSPDAAFPVYHAEKGYGDVHLFFDATGIEELAAGDSPNTIPSRAMLRRTDGRMETAEGVSAHSSAPERSDNAIIKLAKLAPDLACMRFINDMLSEDFNGLKIGLDDGEHVHMGVDVGKTVCVPTILKLVDGRVMLNVNIRLRYGLTAAKVRATFESFAAEYGYECTIPECQEGTFVDPNLPFIAEMNAVSETVGIQGGCCVASGASYCGTMPNHVGWGPVIPPDEGCAHEENERVSVVDFWRVTELYAKYLTLQAQKAE